MEEHDTLCGTRQLARASACGVVEEDVCERGARLLILTPSEESEARVLLVRRRPSASPLGRLWPLRQYTPDWMPRLYLHVL